MNARVVITGKAYARIRSWRIPDSRSTIGEGISTEAVVAGDGIKSHEEITRLFKKYARRTVSAGEIRGRHLHKSMWQ